MRHREVARAGVPTTRRSGHRWEWSKRMSESISGVGVLEGDAARWLELGTS